MATMSWTQVGSRSVSSTCAIGDTLAGAADPTTGATDGASLDGVAAFVVTAAAATLGATIQAALTLSCYLRDAVSGLWLPAPQLDLAGSSTGKRGESFPSVQVSGPSGRIAYQPAAGSLSAGQLTISIICYGKRSDAHNSLAQF